MKKYLLRIVTLCLAASLVFNPIYASASLLRRGSRGNEVQNVQTSLKQMGYFNFPRATGFYGVVTETAVKKFQRDNGLLADGIVGRQTRGALQNNSINSFSMASTLSVLAEQDNSKKGALDWFSEVQFIWSRGADARVTDVDTGKSFMLRRTYGYNHADVEPLTVTDANTINEIWRGWSWERRAVVVQIGDYVIAGSMTAMPHAGIDSAPAGVIVNNRSGGYGRGYNLDAVKGNGVDGHMDIHFKSSRTHGTNIMQQLHQDMVRKAELYIFRMGN